MMPLLYPFIVFLLLLILATLVRGPERPAASGKKDEELSRLRDRVEVLERAVLDQDRDLRRKFDGL
ncbi:hypothetical protein [uncultured Hyphomonas sp.]|uniref:hypothetical protein n=1 Tax=uncultured Hyphomonas sp. TaxID=225298 RepID=UPI002AAB09C4|nr:hypothetical protein [uncultured Hyphomonas sp.]